MFVVYSIQVNQQINFYFYIIRQLPEVILAGARFHWSGQTCWFQEALDWPILMNPLAVRGCSSERVSVHDQTQHRLISVA